MASTLVSVPGFNEVGHVVKDFLLVLFLLEFKSLLIFLNKFPIEYGLLDFPGFSVFDNDKFVIFRSALKEGKTFSHAF